MRHLRRDRHLDPTSFERELVAECEAFLSGRLVEELAGRHARVPAWAWTNLLAHGTERDLRIRVGETASAWSTTSIDWYRARAYLAGEVLNLASRWRSLPRLQRSVLVPLELSLASRTRASSMQPSEWALEVLSALVRHQSCGLPHRDGRPKLDLESEE